MIFRSRKASGAVAERDGRSVDELNREIDELSARNRKRRDPALERRLIRLRHRVGVQLLADPPPRPAQPEPDYDQLPDGGGLAETSPDQLTPGLLRAAMLRDGCLLVRGVMSEAEAQALAEGIERSFASRSIYKAEGYEEDGYYEEFAPELPYEFVERHWVAESGGVAGADSPKLMFETLDALERAGLRSLIAGYLGEQPAISVQKCTLRKTEPSSGGEWHQDGAFLGDVRALNVWLALTHCGDNAPGMDIVPRRLEEFVPTGTEGAIFDWSVSDQVAEEAAGEMGVMRPVFEAGDVLLFDERFLHKTAAEPEMPNPRYAVESWFFGPSAYPERYAPLSF